jgi:hypothetical protein
MIAVEGSGRLPLLDQVTEGRLAHHGKDHLFDHIIGVIKGRFGSPIQHPGFPMDPFEVFQELFFDLALGPGANAVHQFKEQVD